MNDTRKYQNLDTFVRAYSDKPDFSFIYKVSGTKDPVWNVGDRVVTPDGRVFRYALCTTGGLQTEFGAVQQIKTFANAVVPAGYPQAIGDSQVTFTVAAGAGYAANGAVAADVLAGGYAIVSNGTNQHPDTRCILGNTAVATGGGVCTVFLDAALTQTVTAGTTNVEVMPNPYYNVTSGNVTNSGFVSVIGMPAAVATIGQYVWLQTWGPVWITSNGTTGEVAGGREAYFVSNGSIETIPSGTGLLLQHAGWCMDASAGNASNAPLVMLQLSI